MWSLLQQDNVLGQWRAYVEESTSFNRFPKFLCKRSNMLISRNTLMQELNTMPPNRRVALARRSLAFMSFSKTRNYKTFRPRFELAMHA